MSTVTKAALCLTLVMSLIWLAGCRKEPAPAPPAPAQPAPPAKSGDQPQASDASKDSKIEAAFASLTADDRALAVKQKICPVSGELLGEMGTPVKVAVAGHEVFLCCESCKDPLLADPAKHLAKIGLTPAADAGPN